MRELNAIELKTVAGGVAFLGAPETDGTRSPLTFLDRQRQTATPVRSDSLDRRRRSSIFGVRLDRARYNAARGFIFGHRTSKRRLNWFHRLSEAFGGRFRRVTARPCPTCCKVKICRRVLTALQRLRVR